LKPLRRKPKGLSGISGRWFVNRKGGSQASASYTNAQGAASYRTRTMNEAVLI